MTVAAIKQQLLGVFDAVTQQQRLATNQLRRNRAKLHDGWLTRLWRDGDFLLRGRAKIAARDQSEFDGRQRGEARHGEGAGVAGNLHGRVRADLQLELLSVAGFKTHGHGCFQERLQRGCLEGRDRRRAVEDEEQQCQHGQYRRGQPHRQQRAVRELCGQWQRIAARQGSAILEQGRELRTAFACTGQRFVSGRQQPALRGLQTLAGHGGRVAFQPALHGTRHAPQIQFAIAEHGVLRLLQYIVPSALLNRGRAGLRVGLGFLRELRGIQTGLARDRGRTRCREANRSGAAARDHAKRFDLRTTEQLEGRTDLERHVSGFARLQGQQRSCEFEAELRLVFLAVQRVIELRVAVVDEASGEGRFGAGAFAHRLQGQRGLRERFDRQRALGAGRVVRVLARGGDNADLALAGRGAGIARRQHGQHHGRLHAGIELHGIYGPAHPLGRDAVDVKIEVIDQAPQVGDGQADHARRAGLQDQPLTGGVQRHTDHQPGRGLWSFQAQPVRPEVDACAKRPGGWRVRQHPLPRLIRSVARAEIRDVRLLAVPVDAQVLA